MIEVAIQQLSPFVIRAISRSKLLLVKSLSIGKLGSQREALENLVVLRGVPFPSHLCRHGRKLLGMRIYIRAMKTVLMHSKLPSTNGIAPRRVLCLIHIVVGGINRLIQSHQASMIYHTKALLDCKAATMQTILSRELFVSSWLPCPSEGWGRNTGPQIHPR